MSAQFSTSLPFNRPSSSTTAPPSTANSHISASASTSAQNQSSSQSTSPSLPHSPETTRQIAEARTYIEASILSLGTSLSQDLQSRAATLHSNTTALQKQEIDLKKATESLKKENDKLVKEVREGQKKVKELGNVQNWAEMLERDFLVLEETLRLANEGSDSESESSWESGYSDEETNGGRRASSGHDDEEELESRRREGGWTLPLLEEMEPEMMDPLAATSGRDSANGTGTPVDLDGEGDIGMEMGGSGQIVEERRLDKGKGRAVESPLYQMELERQHEDIRRDEHMGVVVPVQESTQEVPPQTHYQIDEAVKEREKRLDEENREAQTNVRMDLGVHEQQPNQSQKPPVETAKPQQEPVQQVVFGEQTAEAHRILSMEAEMEFHVQQIEVIPAPHMDIDVQQPEVVRVSHLNDDVQDPEVIQVSQMDSHVQQSEVFHMPQTEVSNHHSETVNGPSTADSDSATRSIAASNTTHADPLVHTAASEIS